MRGNLKLLVKVDSAYDYAAAESQLLTFLVTRQEFSAQECMHFALVYARRREFNEFI